MPTLPFVPVRSLMLRVCLLSLSVSVVAVACFAAAPLKIKDVAPGADVGAGVVVAGIGIAADTGDGTVSV